MLQDAVVLALDECTANVDQATDSLIQQALRDYVGQEDPKGRGRVLLMIAHRIDTIVHADHLLVSGNPVVVIWHTRCQPPQLGCCVAHVAFHRVWVLCCATEGRVWW